MIEDSCPIGMRVRGWGSLELDRVAKNFATHKNRRILAFSRSIFLRLYCVARASRLNLKSLRVFLRPPHKGLAGHTIQLWLKEE
jgi:hypothetical protein